VEREFVFVGAEKRMVSQEGATRMLMNERPKRQHAQAFSASDEDGPD
jgi:hypothetical protein